MSAPRGYQVRIKRSAEKEMDSLPKAALRRLAAAILSLEGAPRGPHSKKLRGRQAYRLRVGNYRVLYTIDDASRTIEVVAAGHRREVYRH